MMMCCYIISTTLASPLCGDTKAARPAAHMLQIRWPGLGFADAGVKQSALAASLHWGCLLDA